MNSAWRAVQGSAPSRYWIVLALILGLVTFVGTALRAMAGMDPDEAAARGVADGIGGFTGILALIALAKINLAASRWYRCRKVEPWLERGERRSAAIVAALKAVGTDTDARTGRQKRPLPLLLRWNWVRFPGFIEALTYVTWLAFMLTVSFSVERALQAAGGMESAPWPFVAPLVVLGVLSLTVYQIPLAVLTLKMYRLDRTLDEVERLLAEDESEASGRPAALSLRRPALVEPDVKHFGPIPLPGWRRLQPDAQ